MMSLYHNIYTMKKHGMSWSIDEILDMPPIDYKQFVLYTKKDLIEKERANTQQKQRGSRR